MVLMREHGDDGHADDGNCGGAPCADIDFTANSTHSKRKHMLGAQVKDECCFACGGSVGDNIERRVLFMFYELVHAHRDTLTRRGDR